MTRFRAQVKRIFDENKITVVGSPTITSDGIASGFTTANYIASPTTLTINPNIFRICFEFTTGSDITTAQMIIRSMDGQNAFIIGLKSGKMRLYLNAGESSLSWGIASEIFSTKILTTNTKYSGCLSFNGFTYTLNLNNEDWITVESSVLLRSSFALKIGQGMSEQPFLGSVNLPAIRVYSNNELIYSPTRPTYYLERRKEGFDLSKFTVVGSPTITEDGIASGFSSGNYVNTDYAWTPSNNIWEIRIKCKTPSTLSSSKPTILMGSSTKSDKKVPRIGIQQNGKWIWSVPNDTGTAWQKEYWGTLDVAKLNTDYYFKMYFTGTAYKLDYSLDNKTWNNMASFQSTIPVYNLGAPIGLGGDLISFTWTGSIDLKQFSITVDCKEVFTGAKEQYYAMKGGM